MPLVNSHSRPFAWPDSSVWGVFFRCGAWLLLEWMLVYGGANWITGLHGFRIPLQTQIDKQIPFVPHASWVYLSLFPMLWLAPFRLESPRRIRRLAVALSWAIAISGVGFLIFPAESEKNSVGLNGVSGAALQFADWLNLSFNNLPSLHVSMAVVCACIYRVGASTFLIAGFWLWAGAIALSTLLLHQHFVVDVLAGTVCGAVAIHLAK